MKQDLGQLNLRNVYPALALVIDTIKLQALEDEDDEGDGSQNGCEAVEPPQHLLAA
jgi:hypothetical protein